MHEVVLTAVAEQQLLALQGKQGEGWQVLHAIDARIAELRDDPWHEDYAVVIGERLCCTRVHDVNIYYRTPKQGTRGTVEIQHP